MFRLNLKRPDTVTTAQKKRSLHKGALVKKSERWKVKQKMGLCLWACGFNDRQSRPMDVSEDKEGDEGAIKRKRYRERQGKAERERETQFSMKRTAGRTVRPLSMWPG